MNKYRAHKTPCPYGHTHDSAREAKRCAELTFLEKAGQIRGLQQQPKFAMVVGGRDVRIRSTGYPNGRRVTYSADFSYYHENEFVVEDAKGFQTDTYKLKKAFVEAIYGIRIREV